MILTVTLNPSVDHALFVDKLKLHDTNRVQRCERDAGGKGVNLSRVVAELGGDTVATGFLGGGPGALIRSVLKKQGVTHDFVEVDADTRINFSVEDDSGEPPTTLNERGPEITTQDLKELFEHVERYAKKAKWLCMGGSLPPGVPKEVYRDLAKIGEDAGCRLVLDADGEPMKLGMSAKLDLIKPNEAEAGRLLGRELESDDDVVAAVQELKDKASIVIISRAEKGAVLGHDGQVFIGRAPKVETRSTIGSGDSLIGGMLWAIESGKSVDEAFKWGIAAGAATATTDGSEIARRPVIERLLGDVRVEAR